MSPATEATTRLWSYFWEQCTVDLASMLTVGRGEEGLTEFTPGQIADYIDKKRPLIIKIVEALVDEYPNENEGVPPDWIREFLYDPEYGLVDADEGKLVLD